VAKGEVEVTRLKTKTKRTVRRETPEQRAERRRQRDAIVERMVAAVKAKLFEEFAAQAAAALT
jgi:hypothetical protein